MTDITINRAVVEQALEILEKLVVGSDYEEAVEAEQAMESFRAALTQQAEPVEPVAWMFELARNFNLEGYGGWEKRITEYRPNTPEGSVRNVTPLYTAPPKLVPLTEGEIEDIYLAWDVTPGRRIVCLVRAVERALEEKNRGR